MILACQQQYSLHYIEAAPVQKQSQRVEGMVNVMCCHTVLGKIAICCCIHTSVSFLPHDEQLLALQVWLMYLTCEQFGLLQ